MAGEAKRPILRGFFAVVLWSIASCAFPQGAGVQPDASAAIAAARGRAIAQERAYVAEVLQEVRGYQAWSQSLRKFYGDLRQHHNTQVVDSGNGTLVLSHVVDYQLRGDRTLTSASQLEAEDARAVQVISSFSSQLRARGIDLIVVPVPTKLDIYPQYLSKSSKAGMQVSLPLIHLVDKLLAADIEVVNLLSGFRAARARNPRAQLYYRTDHHWTAAGIELCALLIKERLARYDFIPTSSGSYSVKTITVDDFVGPFVGSLIPQNRQYLYPPEAIQHIEVFDQTGNPYDDVDSSPVLVMGDSFVLNGFQRPSYGFTASLARALGMPVSRVVKVGNNISQGPRMLAQKGHDFIESKRVILWVVSVSSFGGNQAHWDQAMITLP